MIKMDGNYSVLQGGTEQSSSTAALVGEGQFGEAQPERFYFSFVVKQYSF